MTLPASGPAFSTGSATLDLRLQVAAELGWRCVCLDPDTRWLWRIERGDHRQLLAGPLSPLNDAVATRLSADKHYAATILRDAGIAVPDTVRCLRPGAFAALTRADGDDPFAAQRGAGPALRFAEQRGYPLVVKPNRGSQGRGVARVDDAAGLLAAVEAVWSDDELALVQPALPGIDLRVDLLDGELLIAYLRRPLRLRGDGRSSVGDLLVGADPRAASPSFRARLRGEAVWTRALARAGKTEDSVLGAGEVMEVQATVLNLNRCCVAELRPSLPGPWLDLCRRVAARLGLRHCGIDLRVPAPFDGADPLGPDPGEAVVLETNASPGVTQLYRLGAVEAAVAAERRVLVAIQEQAHPSAESPA